jgi:hypothetical protein
MFMPEIMHKHASVFLTSKAGKLPYDLYHVGATLNPTENKMQILFLDMTTLNI